MVKLKLVELVRTMSNAGRIAAELAEEMPDRRVELNALSIELYNGAVELKDAFDGRTPEPAATSEAFREAQLEETEAWGLFDRDDLSAEQPFPIATFESESDAEGYAKLKAFIDAPVIRLCKVRGTVTLDVAPNHEAGHG